MVCATLPVPIYIMLLLWIDRYESEPLWMLATAFFWGALFAVFIAMIFNTGIEIVAAAATHSADIGQSIGAVIAAPIVEETSKALIILIFFFWKKDEFDGIIDGIVYAGMVGLGFAMTENILYYGRAVQHGPDALTFIFVLRGMAAPFSHPLFTSMTETRTVSSSSAASSGGSRPRSASSSSSVLPSRNSMTRKYRLLCLP